MSTKDTTVDIYLGDLAEGDEGYLPGNEKYYNYEEDINDIDSQERRRVGHEEDMAPKQASVLEEEDEVESEGPDELSSGTFICEECNYRWEQETSQDDSSQAICPMCGTIDVAQLYSSYDTDK